MPGNVACLRRCERAQPVNAAAAAVKAAIWTLAPRRASVVNAAFDVCVDVSRRAWRCVVVLERVEAIAPAFPVE